MPQILERIDVREAALNDAPDVARLLGELGFPSDPDTIRQRLRSMLAFGESVLVARRNGQVLGVIGIHAMPVIHRPTPVGRLTTLIVTKGERGKGVGRALVTTAEDLLKERGCTLIEVTSNLRLQEAHDFYRRLGYEETSLRFKKELG